LKELKVNLIMVAFDDDGNRVETNWNDVPEDEKDPIRQRLTDRFIAKMGYTRVCLD